MAADSDASGGPSGTDQSCMACRGTGKLISTDGGEPQAVECPWCKGTGRRIPGHDAQARWREKGPEGPDPAA